MIDVEIEQAITLRQATKLRALQRNGRKPHLSALHRWCSSGVKGVVLESIVIGGSRCTSREAVDRWITALTTKANGEKVAPMIRTPGRRERDYQRADHELANSGW